MFKKQIYSWKLKSWIDSQIPEEIKLAMVSNGWNSFGIYELVKRGLSLERKNNLTNSIHSDSHPLADSGR